MDGSEADWWLCHVLALTPLCLIFDCVDYPISCIDACCGVDISFFFSAIFSLSSNRPCGEEEEEQVHVQLLIAGYHACCMHMLACEHQ